MRGSERGGASLRLAGLSKRFGGPAVLAGVDLDVRPGAFVSIVGKSGCGKSTLLRIVAGLDAPSAGSASLDGAPPAERRADVRIMFQEPRLLPWASVLDNVEVGLGEAVAPAPRRARALEALEAVQLAEKAGEWPARLSGGQRQRVALARALVSRPRLLALDEPLGALDALTRITMQALILSVKRDLGFTALLVTHDVSEAVALSDRVIVLDGGRVALDVAVDAPHPRPRGSAELARLEGRILDAIFAGDRRAAAS